MRVFSSPRAFMMFVMLLSVGGAGGEAGASPARDIAQKAAASILISGGTGLQTRPATAWGDTNLLVVWEDKRSGGYDIYGARIDATGKVLDPAGIPIGTATGDQTMPAVAWGNGAWLVVWTDNRTPDVGSQIYAIRVGTDGKLIDSDAHQVRSSAYNPQSMPSVAWSGNNFYVAWQQYEASVSRYVVYGRLLSPTGVGYSSTDYNYLSDGGKAYEPSVSSDGKQFLTVWRDTRCSGCKSGIYGARIDSSGQIVSGLFTVSSSASYDTRLPRSVWQGSNYFVVWSKATSSTTLQELYGTRVSSSQTVLDPSGLKLASVPTTPSYVTHTLAWDGTNYLIVFNYYLSSTARYYMDGVWVDPSGTLLDYSFPLSDVDSQASASAVGRDHAFYVAWDEKLSSTNADVYGALLRYDSDSDGVAEEVDNCPTVSNANQKDEDQDGKGDACDTCPKDASNDADGDGICGDVDNCPVASNANQKDGDQDGKGDVCDACPEDALNDADADGKCGNVDNCPTVSNPGQTDSDLDGRGDACDVCPAVPTDDTDGDGVCDNEDNCPATANGSQADGDADGKGDACDACPKDTANDADGDGACGNSDNCPAVANPSQSDADRDGLGDACDPCINDPANDADKDGRCADVDNCPGVANSDQRDTDHDLVGDVCDPCPTDSSNDLDGDGLCGGVDNCPSIANPDQGDSDGDGRGDACDRCLNDPDDDLDDDGLCADDDNCPADNNSDQMDVDGDNLGDVCDPCPDDPSNDSDGDGVCGDIDDCPTSPNAAQENADGDTLGDACDPCPHDMNNDMDLDGVCGDVDNCPAASNPDQTDMDENGVGDACDPPGPTETPDSTVPPDPGSTATPTAEPDTSLEPDGTATPHASPDPHNGGAGDDPGDAEGNENVAGCACEATPTGDEHHPLLFSLILVAPAIGLRSKRRRSPSRYREP